MPGRCRRRSAARCRGFRGEPDAGLHTVHGAASGSGWMRPEGAGRAAAAFASRQAGAAPAPAPGRGCRGALLGRTLEVAGWPLRVDRLAVRPLSRITTLFSRTASCSPMPTPTTKLPSCPPPEDELRTLGIGPATLLCGRVTPIATPARRLPDPQPDARRAHAGAIAGAAAARTGRRAHGSAAVCSFPTRTSAS